ncbi:TULIP family P47-like protein [Nonomuraea sp. NN258]|uniref:TULIP family P47-like protein n=1 Tax=Nonomuraea antri TaxID=2730852 RepID=UPI00156A1287|nr:TULIP family P47-like protein [Nonomuraea antri]NRQ36889.1 TULIP family P47-like protein [Nonomuraea antri]
MTTPAVYTYGWDTAFAIPVPQVNEAIAEQGSSPAGFAITEYGYTLTGEFGPWQVCQGGDGRALRMIWPLSQVVLTDVATGGQSTFDEGQAIVEVELHYVPHTEAAMSSTGSPQALVVNPAASVPSQPALVMISLQLTPTPQVVAGAVITLLLTDWGTANLADFAHVFAVVDLNRMVDQGQWGFVTPSYTSYAYLDGDALADSVLAVLCMTGSRSGDQLPEQVNQAAIPSGSVAGFVISQARMLDDLVRPAITQAYPGLNGDDFLLNSDATELYLPDGASVPLAPIEQDGITYYPNLTNLTVSAQGSRLVLQSDTSTVITSGITATCTATHWYTITLSTSSNGQTLSFTAAQPPQIVHDIHQSEGSVLTQLLITIAATLALGVLAVLTDGAALIAGGLVIGLIMGADQIIPPLIEKLNEDDSPAIDLLLANAVDPIVWSSSSGFTLDYAALNVSLQLGGDPEFGTTSQEAPA